MTTAIASSITPEDLLAMPDGHRFELIDGELRERNMSAESSAVAFKLVARLGAYLEGHAIGWGFLPDAGLTIFPSPRRLRFADGGFISRSRLPEGPGTGHLKIAPELLIEVVSPGDKAGELDEKVLEYLAAGVLLVWVVYPQSGSVHVYRADGTADILTGDDVLDGEDVLPGFTCPIAPLFAAVRV